MKSSKVTNTLETVLGLAAGLVVGNTIFMPLMGDRSLLEALGHGVGAGFLAGATYVFIAIAQDRNDTTQYHRNADQRLSSGVLPEITKSLHARAGRFV